MSPRQTLQLTKFCLVHASSRLYCWIEYKREFCCQTLFNNRVEYMQKFPSFALVEIAELFPTKVYCIRIPRPNRGETGSLWESEQQILQRLYTQSSAAQLPLLDPCAIYWRLANCQYQTWDTFDIQRLTQNLFWSHNKTKAWRVLRGSKWKLVVWTLLLLINWQNGEMVWSFHYLVKNCLIERKLQKESRQKIPKRLQKRFQPWIYKRIVPSNFGLTRGQR